MNTLEIVGWEHLDRNGLLILNNAHARELSLLNEDEIRNLVEMSYYIGGIAPARAMLIAFDQNAPYCNWNFQWFRNRFCGFIYIDRIVVDVNLRGRGAGLRLYEDLFDKARRNEKTSIVCEVNVDPPNPASMSFHRKLGFEKVGEELLPSGKRVEYLLKRL